MNSNPATDAKDPNGICLLEKTGGGKLVEGRANARTNLDRFFRFSQGLVNPITRTHALLARVRFFQLNRNFVKWISVALATYVVIAIASYGTANLINNLTHSLPKP